MEKERKDLVITGGRYGLGSKDTAPNQIKAVYDEYNYLCDTHTAVAVKVYEDYKKATGDTTKTLIASTRVIIAPGYKYEIVKGIITNFHQPQSTLLLLVSAFVDGNWKAIYDYALSHNYRFLCYGDSSLLLR